MKTTFTPLRVLTVLLLCYGVLLVANCLMLVARFLFGYESLLTLIPTWDFNTEGNIPTLFTTFTFLIAGLLLSLITHTKYKASQAYLAWLILAWVFLFLAMDEATSIHERIGSLFRSQTNTSGIFNISWVIPYGIAAAIFGISYARFLLRLPRRIAAIFSISGIVFVTGAIGIELVGGAIKIQSGDKSLSYALLYTLEESLEMLGVIAFVYGLLSYISSEYGDLKLVATKTTN